MKAISLVLLGWAFFGQAHAQCHDPELVEENEFWTSTDNDVDCALSSPPRWPSDQGAVWIEMVQAFRDGDYAQSLQLALDLQQQQRSDPQEETYTYLLLNHRRLGQANEIEAWWEEVEAIWGVTRTAHQFDPLASGYWTPGWPPTIEFCLGCDGDPPPLNTPSVTYPTAALSDQLEGDCEVVFNITIDGIPRDIDPNCTDPVFDNAARDAIASLRYTPKMEDGKPVPRFNEVYPLQFRLEN